MNGKKFMISIHTPFALSLSKGESGVRKQDVFLIPLNPWSQVFWEEIGFWCASWTSNPMGPDENQGRWVRFPHPPAKRKETGKGRIGEGVNETLEQKQ